MKFFLGNSMEFFLDGHMEAFRKNGGVAATNRCDNLKSVGIRRKPDVTYNAQSLDFARHYGFSLYACNPGKANEKGRVERVIRDIGDRAPEFHGFPLGECDLGRSGGSPAWPDISQDHLLQ
ncbi:MAG TPA: hypothetical protein VEI46_04665 [Thermodesulfovibrionales bacterium]|nr:hypothetical protein [Thermodesulfovibrionales bacterium]